MRRNFGLNYTKFHHSKITHSIFAGRVSSRGAVSSGAVSSGAVVGNNGSNGSGVLFFISPVEGLFVDSNTLADRPDPSDEQSSEHHLEDTAGDGLAVAASVVVVSSDHGANAGGEDVHDHNNGGDVNGNVGVGGRAASGILTFSDGGGGPGVHVK